MRNKPYPLYEREILYDLKSVVYRSAQQNPDGEAFRYAENGTDITITYQQFKSDIEALGTALYSRGLDGGKHIAVLGENSYRWIVSAFSVMNGSNVIVPIDRDLPPDTIRSLIQKADCSALVYSDEYHDVVEQTKNDLGDITIINMKRSHDGILSFDELIAKGKDLIASGDTSFIDNEIENQILAAIFFTSGTTGANKGVMLTQKNIATNAIDALRIATGGNTNLLLLPLHHSLGFTAGVVIMLHLQSCICINRSLKYVADDLKKYQPSLVFLVPLFVDALHKKVWDTAEINGKANLLRMMISISHFLLTIGIDLRRKLFSSVLKGFGGNLNLIICGGAFLDSKYIKDFRAMGIFVANGYGITECSPIVCVNRNNHFRDGSIGRLLPSCEIKIDAADESDEGEIFVRGDYVMLGYYKDEQATAEVFKDGWFKTGDIGRIDKDGFIYITGRIKNIIILANGENIYPEELETGLANIPLVKEVIVREDKAEFGSGSILLAEVFPDYDAADAQGVDNLQEHLDKAIGDFNKTLPPYKHIRRVMLRDMEFPKTTTKKIKRNMGV
jgi:long-chain acyl-CoA synthetase